MIGEMGNDGSSRARRVAVVLGCLWSFGKSLGEYLCRGVGES